MAEAEEVVEAVEAVDAAFCPPCAALCLVAMTRIPHAIYVLTFPSFCCLFIAYFEASSAGRTYSAHYDLNAGLEVPPKQQCRCYSTNGNSFAGIYHILGRK